MGTSASSSPYEPWGSIHPPLGGHRREEGGCGGSTRGKGVPGEQEGTSVGRPWGAASRAWLPSCPSVVINRPVFLSLIASGRALIILFPAMSSLLIRALRTSIINM